MLAFYFGSRWSVKPLSGRKAVRPCQPPEQRLSFNAERRRSNQKMSPTLPSSPVQPSVHPGYLRKVIFENHVITVDLNGNGGFLLCSHPVWNVGVS